MKWIVIIAVFASSAMGIDRPRPVPLPVQAVCATPTQEEILPDGLVDKTVDFTNYRQGYFTVPHPGSLNIHLPAPPPPPCSVRYTIIVIYGPWAKSGSYIHFDSLLIPVGISNDITPTGTGPFLILELIWSPNAASSGYWLIQKTRDD